MDDVVEASEVRGRLFAALEPITRHLVATRGPEALQALRYFLRPFPLKGEAPGARVVVMLVNADTDADAGELLAQGLASHMPTGDALERAIEDVLAGVLGILGPEAADDAVGVSHRAPLVLMARPADGSVVVVTAPRNARPLVLGALIDAPVTIH